MTREPHKRLKTFIMSSQMQSMFESKNKIVGLINLENMSIYSKFVDWFLILYIYIYILFSVE